MNVHFTENEWELLTLKYRDDHEVSSIIKGARKGEHNYTIQDVIDLQIKYRHDSEVIEIIEVLADRLDARYGGRLPLKEDNDN